MITKEKKLNLWHKLLRLESCCASYRAKCYCVVGAPAATGQPVNKFILLLYGGRGRAEPLYTRFSLRVRRNSIRRHEAAGKKCNGSGEGKELAKLKEIRGTLQSGRLGRAA